MRLEENTKWDGRGWKGGDLVEVAVLTLHSFVCPPEPSITVIFLSPPPPPTRGLN